MTAIVPYGYYSLREVFNKVGLSVFGDDWDVSTPNFNEEINNSYYNYSGKVLYGTTIIHPISAPFLISQAQSFTSHIYTEEEIENLAKIYLAMHSMHKSDEKKKEEERSKNLKHNMSKSPYSSAAILTDSNKIDTSSTKTSEYNSKDITPATPSDDKNRDLIKKGIKYAHIAKGLKQITNGCILSGEIVDGKSGKQQALPKEYWIASDSKFSFGTSAGYYKHMYAYQYTWNGQNNNTIGTYEYSGFIIFEKTAVDKFIETIFKPKKKAKISSGGRNPITDWEEVQVEAFRLLKDRDAENLPSQTVIAQKIQKWHEGKYSDKPVPAIKTIKERLKPIYDMLKEPA